MLPGWCCIANRHIGARERRQLIPPHVRFQVPFLGPESQLKSGFACAGLLCKTLEEKNKNLHFDFFAAEISYLYSMCRFWNLIMQFAWYLKRFGLESLFAPCLEHLGASICTMQGIICSISCYLQHIVSG